MAAPLNVFISYSQNQTDRPLLDKLRGHLAPLVQAGKLAVWEDSQMLPGGEWNKSIKENLELADIVLLLVSSDYMASDYINRVEVPLAMQRQENGLCTVIPVLLRSCLFEEMPYGKYEFLPKKPDNQRLVPVEHWERPDEALTVIVRRLNELVRRAAEKDAPLLQPDPKNALDKATKDAPPMLDIERRGYEQQLNLATHKLQRLQTAHLLETDPARQFALEHEIQKLETLTAELKSKLQI